MLSDPHIRELMLANGFTIKDGLTDLKPYVFTAARAIESAATAPLLAEIERLTRELEEARKDAERLTNEQIDAGIKAWFSTDITINEGKDRGHPFRQRMRAAIRAAIKEQTK